MQKIKNELIFQVIEAIINCNSNLFGPEYFVILEGMGYRYKLRNRLEHLQWFLKKLEKLPSNGARDKRSSVYKVRKLSTKERERIISRLEPGEVYDP